jgi:hypothetical protein
MTAPTYGQPLVQPDDIVARIDVLIPRGEDGTPLAWTRGYVRGQLLIDASLEIRGLRAQLDATYVAARVRMLEEALAEERSLRARLAENNEHLRARVMLLERDIQDFFLNKEAKL